MRISIYLGAIMIAILLSACSKQVTAGTDPVQAREPVDIKLLEKAAPQSSALEIYRFDGENTIRRIVFDEAWKDKVINAVNSLKLTTADDKALAGWTEPCYGISMGDKDGMEIWLTYSNGLWIQKGGALYRGELDLATYFDEAASFDRTLEYTSQSGISIPNAAILAKHYIKYYQKATGEEVAEKDGVSLRFISLDGSKVTVEYVNNSDKEYLYGEYYYLQKNISGEWYQIPVALSNYAFNDIAHILNPGGNAKSTGDLTMYGEMEAGHYRIVKENLYAEFDIGADAAGISEHGHRINYELGDLADDFTDTPTKAESGDTVEIRTVVLMDADIHVYLDGGELNKTHSDSDYWGYSFTMPDKDVVISAKPYTKYEIWGIVNNTPDEKENWNDVEVCPPAGSYARIAFKLPSDWAYEVVQTEDVPVSSFVVSIYPEGHSEGSVAIEYSRGFGVCGTGLVSEEIVFNGLPCKAWKGTYDNHPYWDFISLGDEYRGCAIINNAGTTWYNEYQDVLDEIIATVVFTMLDPEAKTDIEIFGLAPSDNRVTIFLEKLGEIPYMYDNETCYNIIPAEISGKYGIDVFKFDQSCMSYLMYDGTIYSIGAYFGGFGITDFALADINGDGQKELYFTTSWGSGMHRSQVGFFDPMAGEVTFFPYSNYNRDMAFRADGNDLTICKASLKMTSFVDITVTALDGVGVIIFDDNKINLTLTDATTLGSLFEEIMSSPAFSSNPGDYMKAHEDVVSKLVTAKDATLRYIFTEFMAGGQVGLKGHIMRLVLDRIAPEDKLDLTADTGQQYFDEWENTAFRFLNTHDYDWLKENHPAMLLLVEMVQKESREMMSKQVISEASFDIDGDGIIEDCKITPGPTSGLFTVVITATVEGRIKYKNTFNLNWGELSLAEKDGKPCIVRRKNIGESSETTNLIYVENGRIVIEGLDPDYEGYWGDGDWNLSCTVIFLGVG